MKEAHIESNVPLSQTRLRTPMLLMTAPAMPVTLGLMGAHAVNALRIIIALGELGLPLVPDAQTRLFDPAMSRTVFATQAF